MWQQVRYIPSGTAGWWEHLWPRGSFFRKRLLGVPYNYSVHLLTYQPTYGCAANEWLWRLLLARPKIHLGTELVE